MHGLVSFPCEPQEVAFSATEMCFLLQLLQLFRNPLLAGCVCVLFAPGVQVLGGRPLL